MTRRRYREPANDADAVSAASLGGFIFPPQPPPPAPPGAVVLSLDGPDGIRRRVATSPCSALLYLRDPRRYRAAVVSGAEHLAPAALAEALAEAERTRYPIPEPEEDPTA